MFGICKNDWFLYQYSSYMRDYRIMYSQENIWLKNNVNSTPLYQHLKNEGDKYDYILMGPYLFGLTHAAAAIHPEKTLLVPCLHDESFAYLESIAEMFKQVKGCIFNAPAIFIECFYYFCTYLLFCTFTTATCSQKCHHYWFFSLTVCLYWKVGICLPLVTHSLLKSIIYNINILIYYYLHKVINSLSKTC